MREARLMGYNAITDSFKLVVPRFSLLEERKLQQRIKDHEQKLSKLDQSLLVMEQKLMEAENQVIALWV